MKSDDIYGWKCTVECDSPYAYKDLVKVSPLNEFTVYGDPNVWIYPKFTFNATGDAQIFTSQEGERVSVIKGANGTITLDGKTHMITGQFDSFNWVFPRFVPGKCKFFVDGNVSVPNGSCSYEPLEFFK